MPSDAKVDANREIGRIITLVEATHNHNPDSDPGTLENDLKDALRWATKRQRSVYSKDDEFSDPLLIAEQLTRFGKADSETILAAILYPSARPRKEAPVDREYLNKIKNRFGRGVRRLVERTLQLRAHKTVESARRFKGSRLQSVAQHVQGLRLINLWLALDPRAILIRGAQLAARLDKAADHPESPGEKQKIRSGEREDMLWLVNNIMAPLAYVCGYGELWRYLRDRSFLLRDRAAYEDIAKKLSEAGLKNEDERQKARKIIAGLVADGCGIDRRYFDIEDRPKSPASTEAKIKRKGQDVGQLGDRLAFRIILKTELENQKGNLDAFCHKVYKALATGSGRLNPGLAPFYKDLKDRDSREDPVEKHAREHTKPGQDAAAVRAEVEVALRDPMTVDYEIEELRGEIRRHGILKKPMQADARYDDYITIAKENGYRAIHDTLCLVIDGREIEIEIQILTEAMHEFNTYGPRAGHSYYKSGMQGHSEEIGDLRACAGEILQGRAPAPNHVHVYANTGEVVHHKGGMTVLDFAVLTDIEPAQIGGARIGNPDPFADRNLQRVYGLSEPLQTADCIAELLDRQGRSLHYKLDSMTPKLPRPALWEYLRSLWPA